MVNPMDIAKRPTSLFPFYKLESETSTVSNDDTESVYSIQDRETDAARDTSDTEHQYELEIEYEVDSLSECDTHSLINSSDDSEVERDIVIAAAIYNSDFEKWVTDGEDSDLSSSEDNSFNRTDFWICVKCKSQNNNPLFRYCEKCFQDRKTLFPPRPRHRKSKKQKKPESPHVQLDALRSCLSGLSQQDSGVGSSQDSGVGSSQECPLLGLDKIVIPQHLTENSSSASKSSDEDVIPSSQQEPSTITSTPSLKIPMSGMKLDLELERIVWIDLEMTGLEIERDKIMEIACLVTDCDLNIIAEGPEIIIHQPKEILDTMNDWCKKQHGKSGLTEACLDSKISVENAQEQILTFIKKHVTEKASPLAGNSVYMDRLFIRRFMKSVDDYLHYRILDVSTVKEICRRWNNPVYKQSPEKVYSHRALDDIKESIEELKFYKQNFFKLG